MNRITDIDWNNVWGIDIEADNLLVDATKIHCVCVFNPGSKQTLELTTYEQIKQFFEEHKGAIFVGHNFVKYDRPLLRRILRITIPIQQCVDTLILSQLYNPDLDGGHSLESWGVRLKAPKVGLEISDWSKLTPLMLERCKQDAYLTCRVYATLAKRLKQIDFSEFSIELQHKLYTVLLSQELNGFKLNTEKVKALIGKLEPEVERIERDVHKLFPPIVKPIKAGQYRLRKDGTLPERIVRLRKEQTVKESLPDENGVIKYEVLDYVPFNLGSPVQRLERLQSAGWTHLEVTKKGNPKVTEESIIEFVEKTGHEEARELCKWLSYKGRINMLKNWLQFYNEKTGCVHGKLFPAATLRFRHNDPNTANIPGVRVDKQGHPILGEDGMYTYESRDCWETRDPVKRTLIGADAKGLEFRMLAHEINDHRFTEQVVDGDIHTFMQAVYEYPDDREWRPISKTTSYAIIYGGQDKKIGSISGGTASDGARIRANAYKNLPGLEAVVGRATAEYYAGRIHLVDGSRIICPYKHAALNYKLQGGGARYMAVAACILHESVFKAKLDALKVGDIHDEWQWDVLNEHAEEFEQLALKAFIEAGAVLKMNCPMAGDVKKGLTWAQTH